MIRLIDAEALKKALNFVYDCAYIDSKSKEGIVSDIIDEIDNAPTVDLDDCVSRKYINAKMFDIPKPKEGATFWNGVDTVGDIIANSPTVTTKQDEWISVDEGLPEALQSVLVTSKSGRVYTSYIAHGDWEYGGEVIAWRPLPEPYKKGGAE